jgi:catecholate siderophore receptor
MRQNRHYRDGVKEGFVGMINDNASIDRIEALRGPSSLLAGVVEPGGMIIQISKRPRTKAETNVKRSLGSGAYLRVEVDVNVPVTPKFALRAVAACQDGNSWRAFERSTRRVGYFAGV